LTGERAHDLRSAIVATCVFIVLAMCIAGGYGFASARRGRLLSTGTVSANDVARDVRFLLVAFCVFALIVVLGVFAVWMDWLSSARECHVEP
jgi:nitrate reductase NapE component